MKHKIALWTSLLCFATLCSCVNNVSVMEDEVEDDDTIVEGETPITFTTQISSATSANTVAGTRVSNNSFEEGDQIGLFAMIRGTALSGKRYIDNLALTVAADGTLVPEKTVYYPEGDYNLDFIAYYPYDADGVDAGASTMDVAVKTDQSATDGLSLSDFLTAQQDNVAASSNAVVLTFSHRMSRVKVELVPADGDVDGLLEDNPQISASGFYTAASFDLEANTFSSLSAQTSSLALGGSWEAGSSSLTGMEMIVIPQTITEGDQTLTLEWNGTVYNCNLTSCTLTTGTQRTVTITVTESSTDPIESLMGTLEEWTDDAGQTSTNESSSNYVQVSALSYTASNVYRIYSGGYAVAEICREYLNNDDISSRAVVAYPVENGVTDLTQGIVLELKDVEGNVCGGSVSWTDDYEFTYTAGTSAAITRLYIDGDGNIATTAPESPAEVSVSSLTIKDNRTSSVQEYAICKVGRVYWMGEDLAASTYRDGTAIELKTVLDGTAGYFLSDNSENYYYSGEAVLAGKLAPEGWQVTTSDDWTNLVTYTGGTAALKTGTWENANVMGVEEATAVTNLSYMSITANGAVMPTLVRQGELVIYWAVDANGEISTSKYDTPCLLGDYDAIYWNSPLYSGSSYYRGASLRCIMQ